MTENFLDLGVFLITFAAFLSLENDPFLVEVGPLLKQCTEGVLEGLNYLHTQNPPVVHRSLGRKRLECPWKLVNN